MLGLNFIRSTFSASWLKESAWSGSNFEQLLMSRSQDFVSFLMVARDRLMCSEDPWTMLGVRSCLLRCTLPFAYSSFVQPLCNQHRRWHFHYAQPCMLQAFNEEVDMQTCIALAMLRNIAYYTNFWTLVTVCWAAVFVLAPFHSRVGACLHWMHIKSASLRKVRSITYQHHQQLQAPSRSSWQLSHLP
jgi:hypothetical protein